MRLGGMCEECKGFFGGGGKEENVVSKEMFYVVLNNFSRQKVFCNFRCCVSNRKKTRTLYEIQKDVQIKTQRWCCGDQP